LLFSQITNYYDKYNVQYCDLVGLPDLCTGCKRTQDVLVGYLTRLASLGVAGIRIDAAKHQDAGELQAITSRLPKGFYIFQEVIGTAGEPITVDMYFGIGQVTEFNYATVVDNNIIPEYKMQYFNTLGEVRVDSCAA
jgi:alpha-amylase